MNKTETNDEPFKSSPKALTCTCFSRIVASHVDCDLCGPACRILLISHAVADIISVSEPWIIVHVEVEHENPTKDKEGFVTMEEAERFAHMTIMLEGMRKLHGRVKPEKYTEKQMCICKPV